MTTWNLVIVSSFSQDMQVNQSLAFKTRDLAFDYALEFLERRGDLMELSNRIGTSYSEFVYEARNGRIFIVTISANPLITSHKQFN